MANLRGNTTVAGPMTVDGSITQTVNATLGNSSFSSGWVGKGWQIWQDSSGSYMEIDNINVRSTLRTHIFSKDIVKAANGYLYITDSAIIAKESATALYCDPKKSATFAVNDEIWFKDVDEALGTAISAKGTISTVTTEVINSITYDKYTITFTQGGYNDFKVGGTVVCTSGGTIYFDASSIPGKPFMLISESISTPRVKLGFLNNIEGVGQKWGLWSDNAFITGDVHCNYLDAAASGVIANFHFDSTGMYTGSTGPASYQAANKLYIGNLGLSVSDGFSVSSAGFLTANSGIVAGWNTTTNTFEKTFTNGSLRLASVTTNNGTAISAGTNRLLGLTLAWSNAGNAGHITLGQMLTAGANEQTIRTNYYGLQMMDVGGSEYFALGVDTGTAGGPTRIYNTIAGWNFDSTTLYKDNFKLTSATNGSKLTIGASSLEDIGIWMGQTATSTYKFSIGAGASAQRLVWDGTNLNIYNNSNNAIFTVTGSTVTIAGFTATATSLSSGRTGLGINTTAGIWLDTTGIAVGGTAKDYFKVDTTGGTIAGWSFTDTQLSNAKIRINSTTNTSYIGVNATTYEQTGIWLGQTAASVYKFSVGAGPSTQRMTWDGSALNIYNSGGYSVFTADSSGVAFAGWVLRYAGAEGSLARNKSSLNDDTVAGIYLGTDGISVGAANKVYFKAAQDNGIAVCKVAGFSFDDNTMWTGATKSATVGIKITKDATTGLASMTGNYIADSYGWKLGDDGSLILGGGLFTVGAGLSFNVLPDTEFTQSNSSWSLNSWTGNANLWYSDVAPIAARDPFGGLSARSFTGATYIRYNGHMMQNVTGTGTYVVWLKAMTAGATPTVSIGASSDLRTQQINDTWNKYTFSNITFAAGTVSTYPFSVNSASPINIAIWHPQISMGNANIYMPNETYSVTPATKIGFGLSGATTNNKAGGGFWLANGKLTITGEIYANKGSIGGWSMDDFTLWTGTKITAPGKSSGSDITLSISRNTSEPGGNLSYDGNTAYNQIGGIYTSQFYASADGSGQIGGINSTTGIYWNTAGQVSLGSDVVLSYAKIDTGKDKWYLETVTVNTAFDTNYPSSMVGYQSWGAAVDSFSNTYTSSEVLDNGGGPSGGSSSYMRMSTLVWCDAANNWASGIGGAGTVVAYLNGKVVSGTLSLVAGWNKIEIYCRGTSITFNQLGDILNHRMRVDYAQDGQTNQSANTFGPATTYINGKMVMSPVLVGTVVKSASSLDYSTGNGYWLGVTDISGVATARFRVGDPTKAAMQWTGTNLEIFGWDVTPVTPVRLKVLSSTNNGVQLGGWTVGASSLYTGEAGHSNFSGMRSVTSSGLNCFFAGGDDYLGTNAKFSVDGTGTVYASNLNMTGGTIAIGDVSIFAGSGRNGVAEKIQIVGGMNEIQIGNKVYIASKDSTTQPAAGKIVLRGSPSTCKIYIGDHVTLNGAANGQILVGNIVLDGTEDSITGAYINSATINGSTLNTQIGTAPSYAEISGNTFYTTAHGGPMSWETRVAGGAITFDRSYNSVASSTITLGYSNDETKDALLTLTGSIAISAYATAIDFTTTSDIRKKNNITRISDVMSRLKSISGYTYTLRDDIEQRRRIGVLAQEVQTVFPELINDSGEYLSVSYGNMGALLLEAIKELNERLERLESK